MSDAEAQRIRAEVRDLRQRTARAERAVEQYREKTERLEGEVDRLRDEKEKLDGANRKLQEEITSLRAQQTKLQSMLFKANTPSHPPPEDAAGRTARTCGGQRGHRGHGRQKPRVIDAETDVFLTHCPTCTTPLERTHVTYTRVVEDIPESRRVTTAYHIERQWCVTCQREVRGHPAHTLPALRVGLRTITLILLLKYRLRTPLARISEILDHQYGLHLTEGGIQKILHLLARTWGEEYGRILHDIRAAPVTHADETGWRINGQNGWCWLFATPNAALYTIEETRGKGVPQRILGPTPEGVLVRDDYGGYDCLKTMEHQSCWAHLLRVSRDAVALPSASPEMHQLHTELKSMFSELHAIVQRPYRKRERMRLHAEYAERIRQIGDHPYGSPDVRKVQTRIRNQGSNLITALTHPDVPLTNNHAERQIRSMAVTRKISGGSRSITGAMIHSVNMSIMQTIALRGKDYLTEITRLLSMPVRGMVLERGE